MSGEVRVATFKLRPWKITDPAFVKLALEWNRVFFGYPLRKKGRTIERVADNFIDYTANTLAEVHAAREDKSYPWSPEALRPEKVAELFNLVEELSKGESYILVPQWSRAQVLLGKVRGFELCDKAEWLDAAGQAMSKPPAEHPEDFFAEFVQVFHVESWRPIPAYEVPQWVRHAMGGPALCNRVHHPAGDKWPWPAELFKHSLGDAAPWMEARQPSGDPQVLHDRLVEDLVAVDFEWLLWSLLERADSPEDSRRWLRCGGVGDGGIDLIGIDKPPRIVRRRSSNASSRPRTVTSSRLHESS